MVTGILSRVNEVHRRCPMKPEPPAITMEGFEGVCMENGFWW